MFFSLLLIFNRNAIVLPEGKSNIDSLFGGKKLRAVGFFGLTFLAVKYGIRYLNSS